MMVGQNTVSALALAGFVERVESLRDQKKQLGDDEGFVLAEAKAAGFLPKAIRHVVKLRAMKPHDRLEAEAIIDQYLHALGMDAELPLFRQVSLIDVDVTSRESVLKALEAFVPQNGSITVDAGGAPVKLTRDSDGKVTACEVVAAPAAPAKPSGSVAARPARAPVPDVDPAGAEALGRQAFKDNAPIIDNPFPFGDARRQRWDQGWRRESGTDGMGPGD